MIFADTGYFIALLDPRDRLHSLSLRWARTLDEPLMTTEYVLVETFNYFSAPAQRFRPLGLFEQLQKTSQCEIISSAPQLFSQGIRLFEQRPDKEWSLTDCISFVVMQQHNLKRALAYDHHFAQAGFEPLLRREPA